MQGIDLEGRVALVTGAARGLGQGHLPRARDRRRRRHRDRSVRPRRDRSRGEGPRPARCRPPVRRARPGIARRGRPRRRRRARAARHHRRQRGHLDVVEVLGDARGPVADHDRRQPHRSVAHVQGRHAHAARAGSRRIADRDQLGRGSEGTPRSGPLLVGEARCRRAGPVGRHRARPAPDPGELGAPVGHQHASRAGPRGLRDARGQPDLRRVVRLDPPVADARRAERHRQRGRVARVRRGPLCHRHPIAGRHGREPTV